MCKLVQVSRDLCNVYVDSVYVKIVYLILNLRLTMLTH